MCIDDSSEDDDGWCAESNARLLDRTLNHAFEQTPLDDIRLPQNHAPNHHLTTKRSSVLTLRVPPV
jgi:uncharacterized protein YecT (DUF1311 family)